MNIATGELHAQPFFSRMKCPRGHDYMKEIPNGWFSVCWYCEKCEYPYHLEMRKMKKYNKENLKKILDDIPKAK